MKTYFQILDLQIQVLDYNSGKSWRSVGSLPFALYATRGINVDGVFYLAGGYHYDGETYSGQCRLLLISLLKSSNPQARATPPQCSHGTAWPKNGYWQGGFPLHAAIMQLLRCLSEVFAVNKCHKTFLCTPHADFCSK